MEETYVVIYKTASELFEKRFIFHEDAEDELKKVLRYENYVTLESLTLNWDRVDYLIVRPLRKDECT
jgi:hypothetical protein